MLLQMASTLSRLSLDSGAGDIQASAYAPPVSVVASAACRLPRAANRIPPDELKLPLTIQQAGGFEHLLEPSIAPL